MEKLFDKNKDSRAAAYNETNENLQVATITPPSLQFKQNQSDKIEEINIEVENTAKVSDTPNPPPSLPFQLNGSADQIEDGSQSPFQFKRNNTGLPDSLKSGIENLSGFAMDDVKVHYNSDKPAQLQAYAYAQGSDIHLGPGQERHLPHEAWHVVQQKQGRVQPTLQMKGGDNVNDDDGLEREADVMGEKAKNFSNANTITLNSSNLNIGLIQKKAFVNGAEVTEGRGNNARVNTENVVIKGENKSWLTDGYRRTYNSKDEFSDHINGRPVSFGLAKKPAIWYRISHLEEPKKFFVLGENHGVFGYRELVKESNISKKVLGEGGFNDLLTADTQSNLQANPEGLNEGIEAGETKQEFMMENLASKALFSLLLRQKYYGKVIRSSITSVSNSGGSTSTSDDDIPSETTEIEGTWIDKYKGGDYTTDRNPKSNLPFYINDGDQEVYAEFETAAEDYDTNKTADGIIEKFIAQVHPYLTDHHEDEELSRILKPLVKDLKRYLAKDPAAESTPQERFDLLLTLLPKLVELVELESAKITPEDYSFSIFDRTQAVANNDELNSYSKNLKVAFAHRDLSMFSSILKANQNDAFAFAGVGDHHAQNLKEELEKDPHNIPVITYSEFISSSEDALE